MPSTVGLDNKVASLGVSTPMAQVLSTGITVSFEKRLLKGILKIEYIHQLSTVDINYYS